MRRVLVAPALAGLAALIGGVGSIAASPATPAGSGGLASPGPADLVLFQTGINGNAIYLMRRDGTEVHAVAPDVAGDQVHPDWSPDGQRIAFVADGDLWLVDVDGTDAVRLLDCPEGCDYPAWSPDGRTLAYSAYEAGPNAPGASSIRLIDVGTGAITDVVREVRPLLVDVPRWAPGGQSLVVGIDQMDDAGYETGASIGVVPAAGGEIRYLRDFESFAYNPDWSWATDTIVFSPEGLGAKAKHDPGDETWNLWTIRPDGSGVQMLTDVPPGTRLWQPSWAPDGSALIANREEDRVGVVIDHPAGTVRELPYHASAVTHPRLQPGG